MITLSPILFSCYQQNIYVLYIYVRYNIKGVNKKLWLRADGALLGSVGFERLLFVGGEGGREIYRNVLFDLLPIFRQMPILYITVGYLSLRSSNISILQRRITVAT